jgi:hypothetical protein
VAYGGFDLCPRSRRVTRSKTELASSSFAFGRVDGATRFGSRDDGGSPSFALYARQHAGQRHCMTNLPSGELFRVSRHPCCALMSV